MPRLSIVANDSFVRQVKKSFRGVVATATSLQCSYRLGICRFLILSLYSRCERNGAVRYADILQNLHGL